MSKNEQHRVWLSIVAAAVALCISIFVKRNVVERNPSSRGLCCCSLHKDQRGLHIICLKINDGSLLYAASIITIPF